MPVDTARLRDLLATAVKLEAVERATGDAVDMLDATYDDMTRDVEASRAATDARVALTRAVRANLPALLDELDAARALLREVRDHGLATFDPARARVDLAKRLAAFLES